MNPDTLRGNRKAEKQKSRRAEKQEIPMAILFTGSGVSGQQAGREADTASPSNEDRVQPGSKLSWHDVPQPWL
ncbi:uncharacterized protein N7511_003464 [Penicillium nucicola]|uniref:uncharacterized protein n=1 Tax=Penicillium nucicola TaxID=1850975 RepID=UPI0025451D85|nr:uncharacterized protein N7511_003464 [Penicillium nucicola]KAJ5771413.1 hypothetical protein N7511_003464 [Penicillium nucicola]